MGFLSFQDIVFWLDVRGDDLSEPVTHVFFETLPSKRVSARIKSRLIACGVVEHIVCATRLAMTHMDIVMCVW